MSIKITVKGIKELQNEMNRAETSLDPRVVKLMLASAIDIIRVAALSNVRRMFKRKSGNLEQSLIAAPGRSNTIATAWAKAKGKTAPHAHLLEFGHRIVTHKGRDTGKFAAPKPFFRPAVDAKRAAVRAAIRDGIVLLLSGQRWTVGSWQSQGDANTRGGDLQ